MTPAPDPHAAKQQESPLTVARRSLNQLTDHGSQKCLDCLHHREVGMEAVEEMHGVIGAAATVIERMANGASRAECSPELDRVLVYLRAES